MKAAPQRRGTILHVTPHLGGGVGRVIANYLRRVEVLSDFQHEVLCLECANPRTQASIAETPCHLMDGLGEDYPTILKALSSADIVLVHWWNHPLLYAFLVRAALPPCRVLFWSHVAGVHPPFVFPSSLLRYPDTFVFTTPVSFSVPEVERLDAVAQQRLRVIWSTGGVSQYAEFQPKHHDTFNVGYIGTVDYSKLHPDFLQMSRDVRGHNTRFVVCGGSSEKALVDELEQIGGDERFTFTGYVEDVDRYLELFDVFGYPLAPYHYGTCEQSLGESMACGIPPVVLANQSESFIVEDGVTGIVAANTTGYTRALETLQENPDLRRELGANARRAAKIRYRLDTMVENWEAVFREVLLGPKRSRRWPKNSSGGIISPANVFIESLGGHGSPFRDYLAAQSEGEKQAALKRIECLYSSSPLWRAKTKGTASHYARFFPNDGALAVWDRMAAVDAWQNKKVSSLGQDTTEQ